MLKDSVDNVRIIVVQFAGGKGVDVSGGGVDISGVVNGVNNLSNGVKKRTLCGERGVWWYNGGLCFKDEGRNGAVWWKSVVITEGYNGDGVGKLWEGGGVSVVKGRVGFCLEEPRRGGGGV